MSSANNPVLFSTVPIVIPVILLFCLIAIASGSIANANRRGERGHPCLVPRWSVKCWEVRKFVMTDALGE